MAKTPSAAIQRLIDVVAQLRDPATGCPWDLEQTHASLLPYVLEEAHEVADAIRQGSDVDLKEELGDLLLQVVLPVVGIFCLRSAAAQLVCPAGLVAGSALLSFGHGSNAVSEQRNASVSGPAG